MAFLSRRHDWVRRKALIYSDKLDQIAFIANGLNFDATLRNLELIGEAAAHVPDAVRMANPQIPWRAHHRYPQQAYPRVFGARQRHAVEHYP